MRRIQVYLTDEQAGLLEAYPEAGRIASSASVAQAASRGGTASGSAAGPGHLSAGREMSSLTSPY